MERAKFVIVGSFDTKNDYKKVFEIIDNMWKFNSTSLCTQQVTTSIHNFSIKNKICQWMQISGGPHECIYILVSDITVHDAVIDKISVY